MLCTCATAPKSRFTRALRPHKTGFNLVMSAMQLCTPSAGSNRPTATALTSLRCFQCVAAQSARRQQRRLGPSCSAEEAAGDALSSEFSRVVNEAGGNLLRHRAPTHLLAPTAVIAAVMDALQHNDWPERDAGVRTAFQFTKPYHGDAVSPTPPTLARSWGGHEEYLDFAAFTNQLHVPPYRSLLECDTWRPLSQLTFPSTRSEARAVQAVEVSTPSRAYTMSFCLERAEQGSLKGCWLVVGVRQGDYSV